MATKKTEEKRSFEQRLETLEKMADQMENTGMSLEEMLTSYEAGMRLVKALKADLAAAEERLTILQTQEKEAEAPHDL